MLAAGFRHLESGRDFFSWPHTWQRPATSVLGIAFITMLVLLSAGRVLAQQGPAEPEDPTTAGRFRFGPVRFTPGISVTQVGIDSNVFNASDGAQTDNTAGVGPAVSLWMNLGPLRMTEKSEGQYLYFRKYDNQRAWNAMHDLRLELPLARIAPFVSGSYSNTKLRPGFEIDSRSRSTVNVARLGTAVLISPKTVFILSAGRTTTAFDQDETFLGTELAHALNRHTDVEQLQLRHALTPLTTLVVSVDAVQDRFDVNHVRNADSYAVRPGFEFKPFALIAGRVIVGFRRFNVLSESIDDYQGLVAEVNANYQPWEPTKLTLRVDRDVTFSFENDLPYYTLTNAELALNQRVTRGWDIVTRGSVQSLGYRRSRSSTVEARSDAGRMGGAGIGYRFGESLRIGFDVNYYTRLSRREDRTFRGLRAGASVSYGTLP